MSSYASGIAYRAFGAPKQMSYGNSKSLSMQYDNRMRMTHWSVANVLGWEFFYSDVGENTGRVMFAKNTTSSTAAGSRDDKLDRSFDYDHLGRLIVSHTGYEARLHMNRQQAGDSTNFGPYSQAYNYNEWGNMTSRVGWGGWNGAYVNWAPTYSNNRLTNNPATGAAMSYDASGNLTYDGYQTFTYDATGQQTTSSGFGLSHGYDGDRLRVKKTESGVTTYYLRSTLLGGQVISELNSSGQWTRGYVYLGGQMVAVQQNSSVSWVHQDPVTKSQRVTNSSGTVTSTIDLDPWGGETSISSNQTFQPHRFTTYERDANGGDEAMMRRYAGNWMRFSQPDPYDGSYNLGDPQSFNRYNYVQNDPVNFVDPTGLDQDPQAPQRPPLGEPPPVPKLVEPAPPMPTGPLDRIITNTNDQLGGVTGFLGGDTGIRIVNNNPESQTPGGGGPQERDIGPTRRQAERDRKTYFASKLKECINDANATYKKQKAELDEKYLNRAYYLEDISQVTTLIGMLVGARAEAKKLVGKTALKAAVKGAVRAIPVTWAINYGYALANYAPQAIAYKQAHDRAIKSCYSLWQK